MNSQGLGGVRTDTQPHVCVCQANSCEGLMCMPFTTALSCVMLCRPTADQTLERGAQYVRDENDDLNCNVND